MLMTNDLITSGSGPTIAHTCRMYCKWDMSHCRVVSFFNGNTSSQLMQTVFCVCSKNSQFRPEIFMVAFDINAVRFECKNEYHIWHESTPELYACVYSFPNSIGVSWIYIVFSKFVSSGGSMISQSGAPTPENEKNGPKGSHAFPCDP